MVRYSFEVWTEVHKTVTIDAETDDEAFKKMGEMLYFVDMSNAAESEDRRYQLVGEGDGVDEPERDDWRPGDAPWNAPGMSVSDFIR